RGGVGHTLRVISGRGGDDAAAALRSAEAEDAIERAARLERAGLLEVLAFQADLRAGHRAQRMAPRKRSSQHVGSDARARRDDLREAEPAHTLKRKCTMSPSATSYSLPSRRAFPAFLHSASLP